MSFLSYQKNNPEFLNNYLKYKRYITFSAQTTIDEAYFDLRTLLRFIKLFLRNENNIDTISIEDFKNITIKDVTLDELNKITSNDLQKFIIFLDDTLNNCPKTRNRKLASIKRFFEYLDTNHFISSDPTKNFQSATIQKRKPKYLDLTESKKLLSNTINSNQHYKIRNYAIICLFLNCSLRLSELTKINLTDLKIDSSEKTLKIYGKGSRERIIYLNEATCEAIEKYLEVRPKLGKDNVDYNALFISSRNKRISNRTVQQIIKEEIKNTFGNEKAEIHTHSLRHTCISLLYNEKDINIFVLKKILGHKCLEATQIYTHISDKKLKEIMENKTISSILEKGDKFNENT